MPEFAPMDAAKLPILYSFRRCPYAMRARLAVLSSERTCELREIVLRDKAPEFIATSPKATVPVLVRGDGTVLEESLDIMFWALGVHDPENLLPGNKDADAMRDLVALSDGPFKQRLDRYKYSNRYEGVDGLQERDGARDFLTGLDARLRSSVWLFGDQPKYADFAILPFVRQFAFVDRPWFDAQPWPALHVWLQSFLASERFAAVMVKYPKWQVGHAETFFPATSTG